MQARWPGEIMVSYIASHSCYRFTVMCIQEHRSACETTLLLAHLTLAHASNLTFRLSCLYPSYNIPVCYGVELDLLSEVRCRSVGNNSVFVWKPGIYGVKDIVPIHSHGLMASSPVCPASFTHQSQIYFSNHTTLAFSSRAPFSWKAIIQVKRTN